MIALLFSWLLKIRNLRVRAVCIRVALAMGVNGLAFAVLSSVTLAQEIENIPARAFNVAAALQNAGLHERAAQKWVEFIAKHPSDSRIDRAHYFLGVCQLHEKKFTEAIATFQQVLQRWPNFADADKVQYNLAMSRFELASADKHLDGLRQASKDFEVVRARFPQSDLADDAVYFQGECLFNVDDLAAAIIAYQTLISHYAASPYASRAYYDLGVAQQTLNDNAAALKTYQAFLNKPEHATHELASEIRLRSAVCLQATGDLNQAAEQFATVAKIPDFALADYAALQFGLIKHDQAKYAEAATFLREFSTKYPQSEYLGEALKLAGHSYLLADQSQPAIDLLTPLANSNDAQGPEAAYWLARAHLKQSHPDQALQVCEQAIARFASSSFLPYLKFARIDSIFVIPSRKTEAPDLYENFLKEHASHALAPQAAYMASLGAFNLQRYAKSREIAEAYLSKPADDETITGDLRFILSESVLLEKADDPNACARAEALYREFIAKHPEHEKAAKARLRIGWCLQTAKKHPETIQWLTSELSKLDPKQQLPEAQLLIGRSQQAMTKHREAITAFNAGIAANESWERIDELIMAVADSHQSVEEVAPAITQYRKLIDSFPKSKLRPQAYYSLGEIAKQQSKADEALQWFQQLVTQYNDSNLCDSAMHAIASLYYSKGQYPQSREWATRVIDGKSSDELKQRARYVRGLALQGEAQFAGAIDDLNKYLQAPAEAEESANAAYAVCLCHLPLKQFDQAQAKLNELLVKNPNFARADRAHYELGHALRAQEGRTADAAAAFQWIITKRSDSPLASESALRVAQYQIDIAKNADEAQRDSGVKQAESTLVAGLTKANDPLLRENMQYVLGDLQFQQAHFADSASTLSKHLADYPNGKFKGPVTFLLAQNRYHLQQYDQAMPLFAAMQTVAFVDLEDSQVKSYRAQSLFRAGECAANLKRWPDSEAFYKKLVQEHPSFTQLADAQYGIACSLQQQNRLDEAITAYVLVTEKTETETAAKARFMIGEIEFARKKFADAIEHFLVVTVGYPYEAWQALARFETARCFHELGNKAQATSTLRELIEKHPDHVRIQDAKKMLSDWEK
jgi:cellulose synthase operon protein C